MLVHRLLCGFLLPSNVSTKGSLRVQLKSGLGCTAKFELIVRNRNHNKITNNFKWNYLFIDHALAPFVSCKIFVIIIIYYYYMLLLTVFCSKTQLLNSFQTKKILELQSYPDFKSYF